ncbi:MAG: hypothetical protein HY286_03720 [Planctomycetes bacterium]|nr:hypothetical protein [Planctomycetota bacterium]
MAKKSGNAKTWSALLLCLPLSCVSKNISITDRKFDESIICVVRENANFNENANVDLDLYSLIIAYWPDGEVIWSRDGKLGGPPYFYSAIDQESLGRLMSNLELLSPLINADAQYEIIHFPFHEIIINMRGRAVRLRSVHEIIEEIPDALATENGVQWNRPQGSSADYRNSSSKYCLFRTIWYVIRHLAAEFRPAIGIEVLLPKKWDDSL